MLLRQLTKKFGPLSDAQQRRLQIADAETVLSWSERVLTANAIDEVLR